MINLIVEDYCHTCPRFEPECNTLWSQGDVVMHRIECANRDICSGIRKFFEERGKK